MIASYTPSVPFRKVRPTTNHRLGVSDDVEVGIRQHGKHCDEGAVDLDDVGVLEDLSGRAGGRTGAHPSTNARSSCGAARGRDEPAHMLGEIHHTVGRHVNAGMPVVRDPFRVSTCTDAALSGHS